MAGTDYNQLYITAANENDVDPIRAQAIGMVESANNPNAVSSKGAQGNMQLMPATARGLGVNNINDPKENIPAGIKYYAQNKTAFRDPDLGLVAYNYGPGNTRKWLNNGADPAALPKETRDYVQKVHQTEAQLRGTMATPQNTDVAEKNLSGSPVADDDLDVFEGAKKDIAAAKAKDAPPSTTVADEDLDPFEGAKKDIAAAKTKEDVKAATKKSKEGQGIAENAGEDITGFGAGIIHGSLPVAVNAAKGVNWLQDKIYGAQPHPITNLLTAAQTAIEPAYQSVAANTPISSKTGEVAGQIGATYPILGAGGELASGAARLASDVPIVGPVANFLTGGIESNAQTNALGQVLKPATWANKAVRLASTVPVGAAGGAAANALVGGSPTEGAEIGAVAGPVISLAGSTLGSLLSKGQGTLSPAENKLQQAFIRDGYVTPEGTVDVAAVQNKLTQLGDNATIADLGPNTRDLAGAVAQTPGAGKDIISSALEERQAGQSERLKNSVLSGLGLAPEDTYESAVPKLIEQREAAATPKYKEANENAQPVKIQPVLDSIDEQLKTAKGGVRAALQKARDLLMNNQGEPDTTLAGLHNSKLALDDAIDASNKDTSMGHVSKATLVKVKNNLLSAIDETNPTYAEARKAFAGPSQSLGVLEDGKNFIKSGGSENTAQLATMSDVDKQFFRIGAAKQIQDTIQNTPDGADAVKRIFNTPGKRDALRSVFPSQEAFDNFANQAQAESTFYKTKGGISGNSLTYPRLQSGEDLATPFQKGAKAAYSGANLIGQLAQRNTVGKAVYLGQMGLNKLLAGGKQLSAKDSEALANALVTPEGKESIVRALTPAAKNSLLENYRLALHGAGIAAISGNQLQQYNQ